VQNQDNAPLAGAIVSVTVNRAGVLYANASGTTAANGQVVFTLMNAADGGPYVTTVNSVSASGYTWNGVTPPNSFMKP